MGYWDYTQSPYNRWDYHTPDPNSRSCNYDGPRTYYYDRGERYWGPMDWWSVFANLLLSWTTNPMWESDHLNLSNDIQHGSGMESILVTGKHRAPHLYANIYLLLGSVAAIAILFIGIGKKFRKNQAVPIPKDKTRGKMVPLWLAHIPLFILTLFFAIAFSVSIWPPYDRYFDRSGDDEAGTYVKNIEQEHIWMGQCHLDNMADAQINLQEAINRMARNFTSACQADYALQRKRSDVQKDKETLEDILVSSKNLKQELKELKSLNSGSNTVEIEYATKILTRIENNLLDIQKTLDNVDEATEASVLKIQTQTDAMKDEMEKFSGPLMDTVVKTAASFKDSKVSLDEAVKKLSNWSQTVANRFNQLDKDVRRRGNPLVINIAFQAIVGLTAITALVCLGFGFLTLAVGLAYPKALNWIPIWTKLTKRLLILGFIVIALGAVAIFYTSSLFLRFTGPATSVCNTLRATDDFNYTSDALRFYETLDLKITLKNTNGKTFSVNFGEILSVNTWQSLASKEGNRREALFSTKKVDAAFKNWKNEISKRKSITIPEIKIADQSKVARPLKLAVTALEDVDFSHSEKSPLVGLVAKEITTFKRQLQQLELASLRELTIPECVPQRMSDYQMNYEVNYAYNQTFSYFVNRLVSIYRGNEMPYQSNKYLTAYKGSTNGFCVQLLVPFSGVWLSTMILGTVLLFDLVVIYKASNRLVAQEDEDITSFGNVNFVPGVSSISSPLLDPKSQEDAEILEI